MLYVIADVVLRCTGRRYVRPARVDKARFDFQFRISSVYLVNSSMVVEIVAHFKRLVFFMIRMFFFYSLLDDMAM